jgi:hypothetical protein
VQEIQEYQVPDVHRFSSIKIIIEIKLQIKIRT